MSLRPPNAFFWWGCGLLVASLAVWKLADANLLAWILLAGSFPLFFEAHAWQGATWTASMYYEVAEEEIWCGAYNFRGAVFRFVVLYVWLLGILFAREEHVLPDNGWMWVILGAPVVLWVALALYAYWRDVSAFAQARGLRKRRGYRRRAR